MKQSELIEYFLLEAEEHLEALHRAVSELSPSADCETAIEDLFRAAHTLKGSAAIVKLDGISNVGHRLEDILEGIKERKIALSPQSIDVISVMIEGLGGMITDLSQKKITSAETGLALIRQAEEFLSNQFASVEVAPETAPAPKMRRSVLLFRRRRIALNGGAQIVPMKAVISTTAILSG